MIENKLQYKVTKTRIAEFKKAITEIDSRIPEGKNQEILKELEYNSCVSIIQELNEQVKLYESQHPISSVDLVVEFHEGFGHPIGDNPQFPSVKDMSFRHEFMIEELGETVKSFKENNLVDFADGLCDLQYVLDGWFVNAGLHHKKDELMVEVHRSNMSKLCVSKEEAEETVAHLLATYEDGHKFTIEKIGDYFAVKREDGKVMKSINFFKPNLVKIINE